MAINKKLIHFNKKSTFNSQKLSANDANTQYQVGGTGTVQTGAPDINYQSIVYIKDSKEIWTHGQFYATTPTIPSKLPTPYALTFTGAVTGTWDGSAAKTVNIPAGSSYTLPAATSAALGGIKVGYTTSGKNYKVQLDGSNNAYVNVPWTDNNTTYSQATSSALGLVKIGYTESGKNYPVELNSNGQMFVNVPWTDTDTKYTLPTATASVLGGIKIGSGLSISNGVVSTGNYVSNVEVGSPSTDWQSAYVPMTVSYRDGSTADRNISLPMATGGSGQGSAGLMSGADKKKLDGLSSGVPSKIEYNGTSVTCTGAKVVATTGDTTIDMNDSNATIDITIPSCAIRMETDVVQINAGVAASKTIIRLDDGSKTIDATTDTFRITGAMDVTGISVLRDTVQVGVSGATANIVVFGQVESSMGFFDTSDARVKTNVKELDASGADRVRLVEFDRTDIEHHGYGVIAQELEEVYPEMVYTDDKGFKSVNYDELAMVKIKYLEDKVARLEALVGRLLAE